MNNKFTLNLKLNVKKKNVSKSPLVGRSKSPLNERSKSPPVGRSKSPPVGRSKSPMSERSKSPPVGRSKSPMSERSKSPPVGRSKSPPRLRPSGIGEIKKKFDYNKYCDPERASIQNLNFDKFGIYKRYLAKMCDLLPIKKIDNIFGPILYLEYHMGDKKIGIFGEMHLLVTQTSELDRYNPTRTVTFTSFMKSLLESSLAKKKNRNETDTTVYDLYSEIYYVSKDNPIRRGISDINFSLFLMLQEFDKCFQVNKEECDYKNLRGHYIDYRSKYSDLLEFDYIKKTKLYNFSGEDAIARIKYINIYFNYFIQKDTKIQNSLMNNIFGNEIIKFIKDRQAKITNWAIEYVKKNDWEKYKTQEELLDYISIALRSLIMDIYTLGRLFKNQSTNQKNVIIYCGASHAMTYKYFFDYINISPFIIIPTSNPIVNMVTFSPADKKKSFLFNL
jgi:hypothetical protein